MPLSEQIIAGSSLGEPLNGPIGASRRRLIDASTERAARVFLREIESKYAVMERVLYGSRARGAFRPDSDADIKGGRGDRADVVQDMATIAFHVMMATGVMVKARLS